MCFHTHTRSPLQELEALSPDRKELEALGFHTSSDTE